jgi:glutathione S-transferase
MMQTIMPTVFHIPVCPFSQRLEILLELKRCREQVEFRIVDITQPRPPELLALADGNTALPVLVADDGTVLRESLVILRCLDAMFPEPRIARAEALKHGVEDLMATLAGDFADAGYRLVMNQDRARRAVLTDALLAQYAKLDAFLVRHAERGPWLFGRFGWAECVFTPLFERFWFLGWYEGFELPDEPRFARVRAWVEACTEHRAARQVTREEIVKLYADYAAGAGNGALPPGRTRSSFAFEPHWSRRPWPPRDKYAGVPSDAALGLV